MLRVAICFISLQASTGELCSNQFDIKARWTYTFATVCSLDYFVKGSEKLWHVQRWKIYYSGRVGVSNNSS